MCVCLCYSFDTVLCFINFNGSVINWLTLVFAIFLSVRSFVRSGGAVDSFMGDFWS